LRAFFKPIFGTWRLLGKGSPVDFIHLSGTTSMKPSGANKILEVLEV
jgi:hypothetical protein